MYRGMWELLLVDQPPPEWYFPIGVPNQLAEPCFQALFKGQEGGSRTHLKGHDVPKGRSHHREGCAAEPCQPEFLD